MISCLVSSSNIQRARASTDGYHICRAETKALHGTGSFICNT